MCETLGKLWDRNKENGIYILKFDSEGAKNKILYVLFLLCTEADLEIQIAEQMVFRSTAQETPVGKCICFLGWL